MICQHRRSVLIAALAAIAVLAGTGCSPDKFEPTLPEGTDWSVAPPPGLPVQSVVGDALDDLVAVTSSPTIVHHDASGWRSIGPIWSEPVEFRVLARSQAGDLVACGEHGMVAVRRDGVWEELPPLETSYVHAAALGPEGRVWVAAENETVDPMLGCWDGVAWSLYYPPELNTGLYRLAVLGPHDVLVDGSRGRVFRLRDGAWEYAADYTEVSDLWTSPAGEVYATSLNRVLRFDGTTFVALDDHLFGAAVHRIAGNAAGRLAVADGLGAVSVRQDGAWLSLPGRADAGIDGAWVQDLLVLADGGVLATLDQRRLAHWDGAAWRLLDLPEPTLHGFSHANFPVVVGGQVRVFGDEGWVADVHSGEPGFYNLFSIDDRADLADLAILSNGSWFFAAASGSWRFYLDGTWYQSLEPAPFPFRAAAAGPDAAIMLVGDGGQVHWGVNGIQFSDGPGVDGDLHDVWACADEGTYWTVGAAGVIARRAADLTWTVHEAPAPVDLHAVWARDDQDVYAVGAGGTVIHWDGAIWRDLACPLEADLLGVMGSSGHYLWVCGRAGALAVHDGDHWRVLAAEHPGDLLDVTLLSHRQVLLLGADGALQRGTLLDP
jgi:hypothetical protein